MGRPYTGWRERLPDVHLGSFVPYSDRLEGKHRYAYKLILPAVAMMFIVHLVPILWGITISFMELDASHLSDWAGAPFVGLDHYRFVMNPESTIGSRYWASMVRQIIWAVAVLVGTYVIGLTAALVLNTEFRGSLVARTLLLLPWIAPAIVTLNVWRMILQRDGGILNEMLLTVGVIGEPVYWLLGDRALWAMSIAHVWLQFPLVMIMLYAGLQSIPQQLYEAAAIDGANRWQRFRYVTLPQLKPVSAVVILLMLVWTLINFTTPYVLFGGNPGESAQVAMWYIHNFAFENWAFGRGAAMSVGLFAVAMGLAAIYYRYVLAEDFGGEGE